MLAVAGGKGGCGKTTTALGVARTLARRGHDPLVVDADCDMPDLHHVADIDRAYGVDALARGAPVERAVQHSPTVPGVALVTAGRPERTGPAIRATRGWAGPVLIDCPAGIGPDATRPLRHADWALVVSTDAPQSLDDTRRTVTAARQLDAPPAGALVWSIAGHTEESPRHVAGCQVLSAIPSVSDPFDAPALSQTWSTVADRLLAGTRCENGHSGHRRRRDRHPSAGQTGQR